MATVKVLVGDLGGTHLRLATATISPNEITVERPQIISTREHPNLQSAIAHTLSSNLTMAVFGIAGPVDKEAQTANVTNLGWTISAKDLEQLIGAPVKLLNDLEACAYGILDIPTSSLVNLQKGVPKQGNKAVIAAGTGLGEAGLYWDGIQHHPWACEGGHCDFAPRSDLDIELLQFLKQKFNRVSWERVLSGPGLANIYNFLRAVKNIPDTTGLDQYIDSPELPAKISSHALADKNPAATQALELFCRYYAIEAANLALKTLAVGGIYLAGGIAPKILPFLQKPQVIQEFTNAGRVSHILQSIPIFVVTDELVSLRGAAVFAQRLIHK